MENLYDGLVRVIAANDNALQVKDPLNGKWTLWSQLETDTNEQGMLHAALYVPIKDPKFPQAEFYLQESNFGNGLHLHEFQILGERLSLGKPYGPESRFDLYISEKGRWNERVTTTQFPEALDKYSLMVDFANVLLGELTTQEGIGKGLKLPAIDDLIVINKLCRKLFN